MMILKNLVLKLRYTFYKQPSVVQRKTVNFEQAKKIGILIYNPDKSYNSQVNDFIQGLIKEGKTVEIVCFLHKNNPQPCDAPFYAFSKNDLDWKGARVSEKLNNFVKTEFDYLYSINILPFLPLNYLLQRSRAKCRIGNYSNGSANLELTIQLGENSNLGNLLKQMNVYSKKIKSDE